MRLIFTLVMVSLALLLRAQDPHFSQYSMAPAFVNPALTGLTDAEHRLAFKYRNQWRSVLREQAYQTVMAGYDGKICDGGNFFGFGFSLLGDRAGAYPFLTAAGNLSVAYHQQVKRGRFLVAGLQAGLIQYRVDDDKLHFDTQFDGLGGYDPSLPNFEDIERLQTNLMMDVSLGVAFYTQEGLSAGLALFHANQPSFSFKPVGNEISSRLNMRLAAHATLPVLQRRAFALSIRELLLIQRPVTEFHHWQNLLGLESRLFFHPNPNTAREAVHAGVAFRLTDDNQEERGFVIDALVMNLRVDFRSFSLGAAYDLNISPLDRVSTYRGGFELSVMWRFFSEQGCVTCPTF